MVKVIREPNKTPWTKRVTCKRCKRLVEASEEEIRYGQFGSGMDSFTWGLFYFICVCGAEVTLPEFDHGVPIETAEALKKKFRESQKD